MHYEASASPNDRQWKVDCFGSGVVMRKSKFSETQIVEMLEDAEGGVR